MTHTIILTTNEWRQLRRILKGERIDTGDPEAIKAWLLYQAGIDADDHRWRNLAEGLTGGDA